MTVKEIVLAHLEAGGFDGLFEEDAECACTKANLAPCDSIMLGCRPGFEGPCNCGEHDFHIYATHEQDDA
jgi:hypothetical protein